MKAFVVLTTLVAVAALGACRKEVEAEPLKLGAAQVVVAR